MVAAVGAEAVLLAEVNAPSLAARLRHQRVALRTRGLTGQVRTGHGLSQQPKWRGSSDDWILLVDARATCRWTGKMRKLRKLLLLRSPDCRSVEAVEMQEEVAGYHLV